MHQFLTDLWGFVQPLVMLGAICLVFAVVGLGLKLISGE